MNARYGRRRQRNVNLRIYLGLAGQFLVFILDAVLHNAVRIDPDVLQAQTLRHKDCIFNRQQ